MTPEQIRKLLNEGEGLTVEFKENIDSLNNSVFETVCSFSNRYGGHILLGVDDKGRVLGVNRNAAPGMKKNFANTLNNPERVNPSLYLNIEEIDIDGKLVLYTYVPVSSQIQMFASRIYDRNEDGDFDITKSTELIAQLAIRKSSTFTERKIFPYADKDQLLLRELMPLVRQRAVNRVQEHPWGGMTDMEIIKSAGLYEKDIITGVEGFNLACVMLFGRDEIIQQAAPGYVTDCLRRVDNVDRYDDRERVECNLIQAFGKCMEFIRKHTLDRFFLIDSLNVSVRDHIAKELVSNVLVHREFSSPVPARIIIEKDRIETENWNRPLHPGRLDPNNFEAYPKNPILARFFVQIGFADTLGSGVRNLYKYTKIYSGAEPELIEGDIFKTIVPIGTALNGELNGEPNGDANDTNGDANGANGELNGELDRVNGEPNGELESYNRGLNGDVNSDANGDESDVTIIDTKEQILHVIRKNPNITVQAMSEAIGVSGRGIKKNLKALKDSGALSREGNNRSGRWVIK